MDNLICNSLKRMISMSNDFEWNEHNFVDKYINVKDTKNKILSTESVKQFKFFFLPTKFYFMRICQW